MSRNKIIFLVGIGIFGLFIVFLMNLFSGDNDDNRPVATGASGAFTIWTFGDTPNGLSGVVEGFKQTYPAYEGLAVETYNFDDYETYSYALSSAIIQNKAPDIFVINNNDSPIFYSQAVVIPPTYINPSDFRKKYYGVFGEDLIISADEQTEYVASVPVGYESLGIYYNRKFVKSTDLTSQASLSSLVSTITAKDDEKIGIALGNGSTIYDAGDIITQYFMLSGADELSELDEKVIKTAMETYFRYGSDGGDNGYNSDVFVDLMSTGRNNLDLFSEGNVAMVIGYPRMLSEISERGYSKNFLLASPFPHYAGEEGETLINYNSFAVNKDSLNSTAAFQFLQYLGSDAGSSAFLDAHPYYLPALLSLESERLDRKIDSGYNINLRDFYNSEHELSSFDKGFKVGYDTRIISILDNVPNYSILLDQLRSQLLCKKEKITTLENLSLSCK